MRARFMGEAAVLMVTSAMIYYFGFQIQQHTLQMTEYLPGINWVYLPSGLRVLLVLVAGIWGALGICLSTVVIDLQHYGDIRGAMLLMTAWISGFGAWLALHALYRLGRIDPQLKGLSIGQLLEYALLYASVSSLGHHLIWWAFDRPSNLWFIDIWPMLVGDLAGAAGVLLAFKWSLRFVKDLLPQRIGDDQA